jgi:toxin YoeB
VEIVFTDKAKADLAFWKKSGNKQITTRITQLLQSILESPFKGIGKPEALKYNFGGLWSRRITQEHRLVYSVNEDIATIISLRHHY